MGKPKLISMATPSFFKVMLADFRTKLRIPPCFKRHLGDSIVQRSVLRNSMGRKWEIKVGIVDDQVLLQDGWGRFISDNSINSGDFLVFFYDGDMGFDVKIYGATCCEKREGSEVKIEAESEEGSIDKSSTMKASRKKERESRRSRPKKRNMCFKILRGVKACEKALEAACAFKSSHPHFVTTCRRSPSLGMRIPAELAKIYNLKVKNSIVLVDPRGTSWSVKISTWGSGRQCLTSGWNSLYKKNRLKEGDACVFEFVHGGAVVNVHIFRAPEYRAKLISKSDQSTFGVLKCQETSNCWHAAKSMDSYNIKSEIFLRVDDMKKVQHAENSMDSDNNKSERFLSVDDTKKAPNEAKSFKSTHPTFVTVWRPSRLHRVYIPKKVTQELGLVKDQQTTLIDPSGKSWRAYIRVRSYGHVELRGGWCRFSRGNNLALGDVCIFEFFGGAEYIKVHIFRT
ncbi:uncharacterized protein A4U43_C07F30730 [Asparagus officinalis]|uniref:TF-B3 domain-containing protein n=1 Tax=Asparagus officinalis TaxID=4686 RepID=A0A5P1ELD7_ASPOF|nr:B3 domain-containing protein REM5-like isoform X2 [Asparagus officinalis]ONK64860.1 uncharacterized protein A4U43_C07F30730 [Asparagus officinalis]